MSKIRPGLEKNEYVKRYIESAVISALRTRRFLLKQGLPEKLATSRAINQALGMIASGGYKEAGELLNSIEKISRILKEELRFDCQRCAFMPSLNLFRRDDIRETEAGGELYVLDLTLNHPLGTPIYHNSGILIGALEDVLIGLHKSLLRKAWTLDAFLWHIIRDLKTSLFSTFTGRYRQASSVLRSALEFIFTGIYFQNLKDEKKEEKLNKEWEEWTRGKNFFTRGKRNPLVEEKLKGKAGRLYGKLSQAVHVFVKDEFEMVAELGKKPARPASAFFEIKFLEEWFEDFIQLVSILYFLSLRIISNYRLRENKRSKQGLKYLKTLLEQLEEKENRKRFLGLTNCPRLLNFKE